jgi:F-type H+-transporting ATPase subunit delta
MADNNTIARPYARAAFELASEKGDLAKWSEALTAAKEVLADGQAVRFLGRPARGIAGNRGAFRRAQSKHRKYG